MGLEKVAACFKELGFNFKLGDFQDRLKAQKIVYLLELKGVKLGFEYNLYARGPYSPVLARDLYNSKVKKAESLSPGELKKVNEFKSVFGVLQPGILEVAATYAFYAFDRKLDAVEATKLTRKFKSSCTPAVLAVGMSKAKEFLFEPTKEELEEMKREFAPWQAASAEAMTKWEARLAAK